MRRRCTRRPGARATLSLRAQTGSATTRARACSNIFYLLSSIVQNYPSDLFSAFYPLTHRTEREQKPILLFIIEIKIRVIRPALRKTQVTSKFVRLFRTMPFIRPIGRGAAYTPPAKGLVPATYWCSSLENLLLPFSHKSELTTRGGPRTGRKPPVAGLKPRCP